MKEKLNRLYLPALTDKVRKKEKKHAVKVREGVKFYCHLFLPSAIDGLTGQPLTTIQKMVYLDGKNGNSFIEQAVAFRTYAKQ
jgi:hypothetical protein